MGLLQIDWLTLYPLPCLTLPGWYDGAGSASAAPLPTHPPTVTPPFLPSPSLAAEFDCWSWWWSHRPLALLKSPCTRWIASPLTASTGDGSVFSHLPAWPCRRFLMCLGIEPHCQSQGSVVYAYRHFTWAATWFTALYHFFFYYCNLTTILASKHTSTSDAYTHTEVVGNNIHIH